MLISYPYHYKNKQNTSIKSSTHISAFCRIPTRNMHFCCYPIYIEKIIWDLVTFLRKKKNLFFRKWIWIFYQSYSLQMIFIWTFIRSEKYLFVIIAFEKTRYHHFMIWTISIFCKFFFLMYLDIHKCSNAVTP